jgi:lipopolysaccharide transport system ATP-binding protein
MRRVVEVDQVSKRYLLGAAPYRTLRETLAALARRDESRAEVWALRDVTLAVDEGEVLGIIGRNGAGKTTLLRVVARIAEPTSGVARTRGRIGTLLEVGTGFHPELTGRENIYLNGAILGMRKHEIARNLDAIVGFAEIESFLDTPVKRYSSGMHMRLAFAVAAHLQPEILLVDEVLAVGDAAFQKKCLGKMGEVAAAGRTVLFVSHNPTAVEALCTRAIHLREGAIVEQGDPGGVLQRYLAESAEGVRERSWPDPDRAPGNELVRLGAARVVPIDGVPNGQITVETPFDLVFEYWSLDEGADLTLSVNVWDERGTLLFNTGPVGGYPKPAGLHRSVGRIPGGLLNDGRHVVELQVVQDEGRIIYRHAEILVVDVHDSLEGRGAWYGKWPGAVRPKLDWHTRVVQRRTGDLA